MQRETARKNSVIMDGRDIGTVILPDAEVKIFLTASPEARAKRRFLELSAKGISEEAVKDVLSRYKDEEDNARILAQKLLRSKRNASSRRTMDVIRTKLVQHGFSVDLANTVISKLDLSAVAQREPDNLGRQIEKAKRKYSRKYSGTELRARIYKSCVQQGYSSSDVVRVLDGMEWFEDEEN
jgi:SOS response regulatory protein OraA/RecX